MFNYPQDMIGKIIKSKEVYCYALTSNEHYCLPDLFDYSEDSLFMVVGIKKSTHKTEYYILKPLVNDISNQNANKSLLWCGCLKVNKTNPNNNHFSIIS